MVLGPGEMRAIIGPNGAGKTTMMDCITGKTRPDEGDIYFGGSTDLTKLDEADIAELGIGRKFQKPTVFENHTVETNILLALKAPRSAFATLFGKPRRDQQDRIDAILKTIRLTEHRAAPRRRPVAMARSNGWRSACCWPRTRSCCSSTSRWPA